MENIEELKRWLKGRKKEFDMCFETSKTKDEKLIASFYNGAHMAIDMVLMKLDGIDVYEEESKDEDE